jgi:hypothetical protein
VACRELSLVGRPPLGVDLGEVELERPAIEVVDGRRPGREVVAGDEAAACWFLDACGDECRAYRLETDFDIPAEVTTGSDAAPSALGSSPIAMHWSIAFFFAPFPGDSSPSV